MTDFKAGLADDPYFEAHDALSHKAEADFQREQSERGKRKRSKSRKVPKHETNGADDSLSIFNPQGQNDIANARRFVKLHGDRVRYCHPWKKWLVWDGCRWKLDETGSILRLAKTIPDAMWKDALKASDSAALRFVSATATNGRLAACLNLASADVPILPEDMDANPWLLCCPNGVVDLRTGELREHRREDSLTRLCPTKFNPDASSYAWDRCLEDIFQDDELIRFVQRLLGYCLTGDVREQLLAIFYGSGANGKSTLLNAYMGMLGPDYSMQAVPDMLMATKSDRHPCERADLFRKRFVAAVETEQSRRLAESMVKQLTGGDPIRARRMNENFWQFLPTHKLILCTNHRPTVRGRDHAIWRRLRLVPFTVRFHEARQDKTLGDKLRAEAEGILAWSVRGCLDWLTDGLGHAEAVAAATQEYRTAEDVIGRFIVDCCSLGDGLQARFSDLYESLQKWCDETGENLPSRKAVGNYLQDEGYAIVPGRGRWYGGLQLRD